ncbi:septal ring lytic transglycosylase RlpA family protein [Pelomonas puraquae]|uniref:Endolytic peptidoglycan transglycosylase RlpA n=2 Tax=Roseateles puraquae TaxID=431059 RepID=A0A254N9Y9_9BURK|nr:septal ring lytic transglycosylase RlpA family protein [Roseateles puraquae]OWR04826.1 septal ring lytic transglycosylase RlpA family lipoprotein [Roseateles puraquae]
MAWLGRCKDSAQHTGLAMALTLLALMTGCATRSPAPASAPSSSAPTDRDGPLPNPPADLSRVPDAVPRLEPIRIGGPNKPYEVLGERYEPIATDAPYADRGLASWYGRKFHGRPTASGEVYNMYAMTAAHATLPIPSYARVRNPANGREIIVRINDRGPFHKGRIIDLSYTAALKLDLLRGVAPVEVKRITYAEIRAGNWQLPANEPAPVYVPDTPPGGPVRETTPGAAVTYWLQFGAFGKLDGAEALRQYVAEADLTLLPLLTIVREAGLHRLRAGPFPTADEARSTATRLRETRGLDTTLVEKR